MKPSTPSLREAERSQSVRRFDRLFDQFAPRVMGYLLRLTSNQAEAEDLTQETFLAAFQGQDGFQGRSQPLTWLLGIARRRLHERTRRASLPTERLKEDQAQEADPADRLALAATLTDALDRLGEAEREVLLLTAVQGLSYREAAEILGEPLGTVKWRAHEATKQLRRILNAADERYEARYGSKPTEQPRIHSRSRFAPGTDR